jgi:mRNA-processing protein COX24
VALACARPLVRPSRARRQARVSTEGGFVGSVIKKRRKRMAKKKHRKLLRKTRVQRRNKK